jgi:hypothetical protein
MIQFLVVAAAAFLIFGVLLTVLHVRAQNGSETGSVIGGCGRSACRCRRKQPPAEEV